MTFGYHGCYLRVDVSRGTAERVPLADKLLRQFIGGSGLGVRILLDEEAAELDPLSPEAPLVFAFSPLVGSPLTTSAKFAVVSKSPLTNRLNDSLASSGFAIAGKACGCDSIMIVGRAPELSVLVLEDVCRGGSSAFAQSDSTFAATASADKSADRRSLGGGRSDPPGDPPAFAVRLESAADCAGKTCGETETALRARLGASFRIASIGPAGERLVRYATI